MSTEVGELTASIPFAGATTGCSFSFDAGTGAGAGLDACGGTSVGSGCTSGGVATGAISTSAVCAGDDRSVCTALTLVICLDRSAALSANGDASAALDLGLNRGRLAINTPTMMSAVTPTNHRVPGMRSESLSESAAAS